MRVGYDRFDVGTNGTNYFTLLGGSQYVFDCGPGIGFVSQNQQLYFSSPVGDQAIDSPADGEVAAYQASSGQFEWVANGSGGGGTVTSVALTETGSALTITGSPITGSGTINIAGAGTSSQVILGDLTLGTLTSGTVTSVSSSQAFITIATPTTTPSISIGNASASATGVLTATDWNGTDAGLTNERVLTAGSGISFTDTGAGGTLTIEATGGGGGIGGSITDNQVAVGATTADEIEGYSDFTYNSSTNTLTVGEKIDSSGTSQLQLIAGSSSISILDSGVANHININPASNRINAQASTLSLGTSSSDATLSSSGANDLILNTNDGTNSGSIVIADGANGQISITPNGSGTIKLDGVNLDNSAIATGYVLKATSTTAAGWAAESGGGGSTLVTSEFPASDTLWSMPSEFLGAVVISGNIISTQWANSTTRIRPHFIQQAGTLDKARLWLQAAPTGTEGQTFTLAIWNADTNGGVGTLKCQSTFTIGTGATAPEVIESGWVAETGESLSVDIGELYWIGFYSTYSSTSTAATFRFIRGDGITHLARRDNVNTSYAVSITRFYSSTSGSPSTLGDNPTIDKGDGTNSTQGTWPYIWYTVT
jgi:hypothetical protein